MICTLAIPELAQYISRQLNHFYPDGNHVPAVFVEELLPAVLIRFEKGLSAFKNSYFWQDGQLKLDHLHSDQYSTLLYLLGSTAGREDNESHRMLAAKTYMLNKALHGLDAYYQVELPDSIWFAHAVGSVLGRASYSGPLIISQCCTIGNRDGQYPEIGSRVMLCAGSLVLGKCRIGDDVCIGAGSLLIDAEIPAGSTVVGRYPDIRIIPKKSPLIDQLFLQGPAHPFATKVQIPSVQPI
jgi:serine O-acetyltransferase